MCHWCEPRGALAVEQPSIGVSGVWWHLVYAPDVLSGSSLLCRVWKVVVPGYEVGTRVLV